MMLLAEFNSTQPNFVFGVDVDGLSGGLVVLGWTSSLVNYLASYSNFIFCKIKEPDTSTWYVCFVYMVHLL